MLVLSRHRDESIIIGDDIVITVVDIRGDKVRLGIAAPIEISVHRQEVYDAIQRENRQASRLEPNDARQIDRLNQPVVTARAAPTSVRGHLRPIVVESGRVAGFTPMLSPLGQRSDERTKTGRPRSAVAAARLSGPFLTRWPPDRFGIGQIARGQANRDDRH